MDLFRATSWKQSIIIMVRIVLVDVTSYSDNGKYQAVLLLRIELNLVGFKWNEVHFIKLKWNKLCWNSLFWLFHFSYTHIWNE